MTPILSCLNFSSFSIFHFNHFSEIKKAEGETVKKNKKNFLHIYSPCCYYYYYFFCCYFILNIYPQGFFILFIFCVYILLLAISTQTGCCSLTVCVCDCVFSVRIIASGKGSRRIVEENENHDAEGIAGKMQSKPCVSLHSRTQRNESWWTEDKIHRMLPSLPLLLHELAQGTVGVGGYDTWGC